MVLACGFGLVTKPRAATAVTTKDGTPKEPDTASTTTK